MKQDFLEINSTTSIAPILTPLPLPASLARWAKVSLDLEFEKALVLLPKKSSALGSHNGAKHFMNYHLTSHTYMGTWGVQSGLPLAHARYLGRPISSAFGIGKVGTKGLNGKDTFQELCLKELIQLCSE